MKSPVKDHELNRDGGLRKCDPVVYCTLQLTYASKSSHDF